MFRVIPEKILFDERLSDKAKFILADIISFTLNDKSTFASNKWFQKRYGFKSTNSVSRIISDLVRLGYVERTLIYHEGTKQIKTRILIPTKEIMYSTLKSRDVVLQSLMEQNPEEDIEREDYDKKKSIDFSQLRKIWEE